MSYLFDIDLTKLNLFTGGINEIEVVRSPPGVGTVIVCWNIVARYSNQTEAAQRFTDVEGSITFAPVGLNYNFQHPITLMTLGVISIAFAFLSCDLLCLISSHLRELETNLHVKGTCC